MLLLVRRHGLDALVVLLTASGVVELAARPRSAVWPRDTLWLDIPAIVLLALPLLARRWLPFAALAAYWPLGAAISFVDGRLIPSLQSVFVLGMAVAFLVGSLPVARQARLGLVLVLGGVAIVVGNLPGHSAGQLLLLPLLFGICWLAGFAMHERTDRAAAAEARAAQAERDREAAARIAVAEERARIARELHDIVAHAVSVMVLQVGAVRHRLPDALEEEGRALRDVEQVGRTALAEMRRLLGGLRRDGEDAEREPQPGLDRLDRLLEEVRSAGLPVRLQVEGEPVPLPRPVDLSAYRIAQEGLTNALKHAHASHADVTVDYEPDAIRIEVRDDGVGASANDGLGSGLVGMRERVKVYGGDMSAGPGPEGGFVLRARLPLSLNRS
jgi:signal transduction histidine kinase